MQRHELEGGIGIHRFDRLPDDRLDALVTTRRGGVSAAPYESLNLGFRVGDEAADVVENRRRLFAAVGMPLSRSVWCRQVHEAAVHLVTEADIGRGAHGEGDIITGTDAMVTDLVDAPLCVIVADCVPVVIYDPDAHVLGVAHAGWAGTVKRISSVTVKAMVEHWGCDPARMLAAIGPSIGPDEYEVGPEVAEAARAAYGVAAESMLRPSARQVEVSQEAGRAGEVKGAAGKKAAPAAEGRHSFDLWRANLIDLGDAGVPAERIEVAGLSSVRQLDDFYSHRAEGVTGRFAAIAALRPPPGLDE